MLEKNQVCLAFKFNSDPAETLSFTSPFLPLDKLFNNFSNATILYPDNQKV